MLEKALEEIYKIYPFISISIVDNSEVHAVSIIVEFYFRGKHWPIKNSVSFTLDEINNDKRLISYLVEDTLKAIRHFIDKTVRED
jgi:hypothetical protein